MYFYKKMADDLPITYPLFIESYIKGKLGVEVRFRIFWEGDTQYWRAIYHCAEVESVQSVGARHSI